MILVLWCIIFRTLVKVVFQIQVKIMTCLGSLRKSRTPLSKVGKTKKDTYG